MNDLPRDLFEKVLTYYQPASPTARIMTPYLEIVDIMTIDTWKNVEILRRLHRKGFVHILSEVHYLYHWYLTEQGYTAKVLIKFAQAMGGWVDPRVPEGRMDS